MLCALLFTFLGICGLEMASATNLESAPDLLKFDMEVLSEWHFLFKHFILFSGYNVYSEPWRKESNLASNIYRPGKNIERVC